MSFQGTVHNIEMEAYLPPHAPKTAWRQGGRIPVGMQVVLKLLRKPCLPPPPLPYCKVLSCLTCLCLRAVCLAVESEMMRHIQTTTCCALHCCVFHSDAFLFGIISTTPPTPSPSVCSLQAHLVCVLFG